MNPGLRLSAALTLSLVLWSPTALAALRGDIDLGAAGLRYILALAFARLAVGVLWAVVGRYMPDEDEPEEAEPGATEPNAPGDYDQPPLRRRDDPKPADADPQPEPAPPPPPAADTESWQADRPL